MDANHVATYAAIGTAGLAAIYLLTPNRYKRIKIQRDQESAYLGEYKKGQPVFDVRPNGSVEPKYAAKGVASVRYGTLIELVRDAAKHNGNKIAMRIEENNWKTPVGPWKSYTWNHVYDQATRFAKALLAIGFERYRGVSICAFNTPEWHLAHLGAIFAGGVSAGIYTTNTVEASHYIAEHSESRVVVVDNMKTAQKFLEVRARLPLVKKIVVFQEAIPADKKADGYLVSWDEFLALGAGVSDADLQNRISTIKPTECASLIYTSGTTGHPKACMISHDAVQFAASSVLESSATEYLAEEHIISYLPLSHIAAQQIDITLPIIVASKPGFNCTIHYARPDVLKGSLPITLKAVRPTFFLGVPRVWEKFVEGIKEKAKANPVTGLKKHLVDWAKDVGLRAAISRQVDGDGIEPRGYAIADKLIFTKVRQALGLDRCRLNLTGAAPITKETLSFLASLGIIVNELYGMSESSGCATVSSPHYFKWGSCGFACSGQEVRIFHEAGRDKPGEGEICFRGRQMMMGYLKSEDKTREAMDSEGWMHSGDIGRFDEYGLLYITGRIKELIIGAGGENIAPVPIEDEIKRLLPALSNVVMIGDKRKYNVVLVTLKTKQDHTTGLFTDELINEALSVNPAVRTVSAALTDKAWNDFITKGIKEYNNGPVCVSNAQKIQYFRILPADLSIPGGDLTPTMKLKRNVINDKYKDVIDTMYKD